MPDWVSHILIALIIVELFNIKPKSLVLFGALLPDFFFKTTTIGNFIDIPVGEFYWILLPIHIPLGSFLFTLIIAQLFRFNYVKTIILISIGWITHYASDALFRLFLVNPQAMLFFPFSWKMFSFELLWMEQFYMVLIITLIVYIIIKLVKYRRIRSLIEL